MSIRKNREFRKVMQTYTGSILSVKDLYKKVLSSSVLLLFGGDRSFFPGGADDTAKAIDYLEKAGQNALQMGDYEQAERYFKECLELDATAAVLSAEFFEKKLKS